MGIEKYFATRNAHEVVAETQQDTPLGEFLVMVDSIDPIKSTTSMSEGANVSYIIQGGQSDGVVIREGMFFIKKDGKENPMALQSYALLCIACGFDDIVPEEQLIGKRILLKTEKKDKYVNFTKAKYLSTGAQQAQPAQSKAATPWD